MKKTHEQAVKDAKEAEKRMNETVKHIKRADTSKVLLSSKPYSNKDEILSR